MRQRNGAASSPNGDALAISTAADAPTPETAAVVETPFPWGPAASLSASTSSFVAPGQIIGAALLLLGSLIYTGWAAGAGREARAGSPLLSVAPIT